jgi:hypothetical protein
MPITFACECGKSFTVGTEFAGRAVTCPACGAALTVPGELSDESTDEPARAKKGAGESNPTLNTGIAALAGGSVWLALNLFNDGNVTVPPLAVLIFGAVMCVYGLILRR